jgi:hypothetical protein
MWLKACTHAWLIHGTLLTHQSAPPWLFLATLLRRIWWSTAMLMSLPCSCPSV